MKTIVSLLPFAICLRCFAHGDTNLIAASEWSKPVSLRNQQMHHEAIRGRLLILKGSEPAYGGPEPGNGAMTFVELQNVTGAYGEGSEIHFAVTNLHCELTDATGKSIKPDQVSWDGRGPFPPYWAYLPYNSTIRLFVNGGSLDPLFVYPGGEPWTRWSIPKTDTNTYYLSGTLRLSTHASPPLPPNYFNATLVFPKTKITCPASTGH